MVRFKYNPFKYTVAGFSAFLLICTLLFSCAQVVAPGGGIKDEIAPKVVKYKPDSAQLHFNARIIEIDFNEFIQLKDLNNQLIISPPMEKAPDITIKNKTLTIELDKNQVLKPNTTYSINFGNAVQDLNENNPLENFRYIFSTGSFIDSLSLKGKVQNSFDQSTESGLVVMLYADMSDSVVYKSQPDYFAKTGKDGIFLISNIKAGSYKLIAIKDANANFKYDGETERIGFVGAPIDVNAKQEILIDLFQEPAKKIYLKKHLHDSYGKVSLFFNQGSDSLRIRPLNNDQKGVQEFAEFSKNRDTLTYWIKNFQKDSLILHISNGNQVVDTLFLKFIQLEDALKSKKNPLKLKVISSPNGNQSFDLGAELKLQFSSLISDVQNERIRFMEDSLSFQTKEMLCTDYGVHAYIKIGYCDTTIYEDPENPGTFIAAPEFKNLPLKENTNYHLLIPPGAITDIFGLTNDSIKVDVKTREEKYYGSVKLNLTVPPTDGTYIVQLLDEKGAVVRENSVSKSIVLDYAYLHPKKYKVKIIYDDNGNHKWDTGNYLKKIQPEKVIYNTELINIRSNWDAELDWKVSNE